jgi:hypothetical protein
MTMNVFIILLHFRKHGFEYVVHFRIQSFYLICCHVRYFISARVDIYGDTLNHIIVINYEEKFHWDRVEQPWRSMNGLAFVNLEQVSLCVTERKSINVFFVGYDLLYSNRLHL